MRAGVCEPESSHYSAGRVPGSGGVSRMMSRHRDGAAMTAGAAILAGTSIDNP